MIPLVVKRWARQVPAPAACIYAPACPSTPPGPRPPSRNDSSPGPVDLLRRSAVPRTHCPRSPRSPRPRHSPRWRPRWPTSRSPRRPRPAPRPCPRPAASPPPSRAATCTPAPQSSPSRPRQPALRPSPPVPAPPPPPAGAAATISACACAAPNPDYTDTNVPDRDHGAGVPRCADSSRGAGVGPDQPRSQPARLTRTTTSPTMVLIDIARFHKDSGDVSGRADKQGAEVRILDQC